MPAVGQPQADGIPKPRPDFLRTDGKLIKLPDQPDVNMITADIAFDLYVNDGSCAAARKVERAGLYVITLIEQFDLTAFD